MFRVHLSFIDEEPAAWLNKKTKEELTDKQVEQLKAAGKLEVEAVFRPFAGKHVAVDVNDLMGKKHVIKSTKDDKTEVKAVKKSAAAKALLSALIAFGKELHAEHPDAHKIFITSEGDEADADDDAGDDAAGRSGDTKGAAA